MLKKRNFGEGLQGALANFREMKQRQKHDLVKLVKDYYTRPKDSEKYKPSEVTNRNGSEYTSEISKRSWDTKRTEQLRNGHCAHFSVNYQPYQALGSITLEAGELLLDVLNNSLPQHFIDEYFEAQPGDTSHLNKYLEREKVHQDDQEISYRALADRYKQSNDAGLHDIRKLLKETESRVTATKAGQVYSRHLNQCQDDKDLEKQREANEILDAEQMILRKLSSDLLFDTAHSSQPTPACDWERRSVDTAVSDNSSYNDNVTTDAAYRRKLALTNDERILMLQPRGDDMKSRRQNLRFWNVWVKLTSIYNLLCSLHHVRSRHLKSKTPLTKNVFNSLKRDPFTQGEAAAQHPTSRFSTRVSRDTLKSPYTTSHGNTPVSRPPTNASPAPVWRDGSRLGNPPTAGNTTGTAGRDGSRLGVQPAANTNLSAMIASRGSTRKKGRTLASLFRSADGGDAAVNIDTWDDLLNLHTAKNKFLKLVKKLPPWQKNYNTDDFTQTPQKIILPPNNKKTDVYEQSSDTYRSEKTVHRVKLGTLLANEQYVKKVLHELERIEREQLLMSRYKLEAFDEIDPLFDLYQRRLRDIKKTGPRDPEMTQEEMPEWYTTLVEETKAVNLHVDADIQALMAKLENFVLNDPCTIPQVKEKLSLLICSMPVFDLCTNNAQTAIKFLLQKILNCNLDLFRACLEFRNMKAAI